MPETTPMMEQYVRIKDQHKDAILFFRLGDFYEMFRDDATVASRILGLTLTKRQDVPMCGVPYHAARNYIGRLIKAGKKVAICEQTTLPSAGKGIVEREVVEVVTPGTATEEAYLEASANNYLVSIAKEKETVVLAYVDVSTGEFGVAGDRGEEGVVLLRRELARLRPREVLVQQSLLGIEDLARPLAERPALLINRYPDWHYDTFTAHKRLCSLLGVSNLKAFGIDEDSPLTLAAGVLIDYLDDTARSMLPHIRDLSVIRREQNVGLDESTIRNLELITNLQDGSKSYSLFETIDFTQTAMGSRLLRQWILSPLRNRSEIGERQNQVTLLFRNQQSLLGVRSELAGILDIERLVSRVAMDRAHGKDLVAIRTSLAIALRLVSALVDSGVSNLAFVETAATISTDIQRLVDILSRSLVDEPSTLLTEGNLIKEGYDEELDSLRSLQKNSRTILEEYVLEEREQSGISAIRVRHNRVLGHFLEVTKTHAERVPSHFIRRQTLTNAERFTTDRLSEIEQQINAASERIVERERELFLEVRQVVKDAIEPLLALARAVSRLDVYQSFAHAATVRAYTAPSLNDNRRLSIDAGRHPVVEAHLPSGQFVPNGIVLDHDSDFLALITGPNMAGKSTFLRQTALIVLMAQIGSYVPADAAEIGMVDRVFCRVGASDNLARGESTFLVEMNEAAFILRNATPESLVIMDEIGRGTSTNDGRAIAQAVLEYLTHHVRPRSLFATHFHELTAVEAPGLINMSLTVEETKGRVVFLKKIQNGPSNNSYGIHVAKLAGIPGKVIDRAQEILATIVEQSEGDPVVPKSRFDETSQSGLFAPSELILSELASIEIDHLRPIEALTRIARWKEEMRR